MTSRATACRRRWESAVFLKVHDEIRAGNLAIEGAKNFGRFEAFFLPSLEWEQIREAFWVRTGLPSNPDSAVDQLKARLSDAVDRFLEGIPDNRQVASDDNGVAAQNRPGRDSRPGPRGKPRRAASLARRAQPLDPAGRSAHRGRERPRIQCPLLSARREAGRPRRGVCAARCHSCSWLQSRSVHHGEDRTQHSLQETQACQRLALDNKWLSGDCGCQGRARWGGAARCRGRCSSKEHNEFVLDQDVGHGPQGHRRFELETTRRSDARFGCGRRFCQLNAMEAKLIR